MHVREVVIVVIGHEDRPVHQSHGLLEAGVDRGAAHFVFREYVHPAHEIHTACAEPLEHDGDRQPVVIRIFGSAVLEISGREIRRAREKILEAFVVENAQVGEMGNVFLYRPFAVRAACEHLCRHARDQLGGTSRRSAQPLNHGGESAQRKIECEGAVEPAHWRYHMIPGKSGAGFRWRRESDTGQTAGRFQKWARTQFRERRKPMAIPKRRGKRVRAARKSAPGKTAAESAATDMALERWRADTPGCQDRIHLNNAGAALPPQSVVEVMHRHLDREAEIGGYEAANEAASRVQEAYEAVGRIVNSRGRNIAIVENATVAIAQALSVFDFKPGDVLVTTRCDYPSNQLMYLSLAQRTGLVIKRATDLAEGGVDPASVRKLIRDPRCRLVVMTWVPTNSGLVQDVAAVGAVCEEAGIPFVVDACQAVGQIRVDVHAVRCDYLAGTARKFLRGPRGIGFLYVSDRVLAAGAYPLYVDMRGADWETADEFQLARGARRFENWEYAYALVLGMGEAARYALAVGNVAFTRSRELAADLREKLEDIAAGADIRSRGRAVRDRHDRGRWTRARGTQAPAPGPGHQHQRVGPDVGRDRLRGEGDHRRAPALTSLLQHRRRTGCRGDRSRRADARLTSAPIGSGGVSVEMAHAERAPDGWRGLRRRNDRDRRHAAGSRVDDRVRDLHRVGWDLACRRIARGVAGRVGFDRRDHCPWCARVRRDGGNVSTCGRPVRLSA